MIGLLAVFEEGLVKLIEVVGPFVIQLRNSDLMVDTWAELIAARAILKDDIGGFRIEVAVRVVEWIVFGNGVGWENVALHLARERLHTMAERCRDLTKEIDFAAKLVG